MQQPDLVAAAPPDTHPNAEEPPLEAAAIQPAPPPGAPQGTAQAFQPPPPSGSYPVTGQEPSNITQPSIPVRSQDPGLPGTGQAPGPLTTGPDVIANNHEGLEAAVGQDPIAPEAPEPAHEAVEQAYPYYDHHHPPDIINTEPPPVASDRNLYMQTGELNNLEQVPHREPVDGGNEEVVGAVNVNNDVNNLPMDRLVIGENEPVQARSLAGIPNAQRSEAAGESAENPPPMFQPLGSVPPPPMTFPGPPLASEGRSEAAGSDVSAAAPSQTAPPLVQPPPMMMPFPSAVHSEARSEAVGSEVNHSPIPNVPNTFTPPALTGSSEERSEAVGSEETPALNPMGVAPPPMTAPPMMPAPQRIEAVGASNQPGMPPIQVPMQRSEAAGSASDPTMFNMTPAPIPITFPPPGSQPPAPEIRSEAAGSDLKPDPVQVPLPPATPFVASITPTASEERSEAAGSDRKDIPPVPAVSNPNSQLQRNVMGSDNSKSKKNRNRKLADESDEEESIFSRESEKRGHRSKRQVSPDHHHKQPRHRRRSPSASRSSSLSEEESFQSSRRNDYSRRDHNESRRRSHNTSKRDDYGRKNSHRYQSSRDDSKYHYDHDRRNDNRDSRRRHQESYSHSSRPSSRQGYPGYHYNHSSYYYPPQNPYGAPGAAMPTPDQSMLVDFKKNWEYYSRNPQEWENLRVNNHQKYENLLR